MAETEKSRGIEYWQDTWNKNDIGFHKSEVHKMLQKHITLLNPEGKELKFLVPLCGKTLDMKWLLDQGHSVTGVDGVKKALETFFTEHSLEWTEENAPNMGPDCKLLKQCDDGKLKLFFGDMFLFNKSVEGQFDCVWDRGSLVALDRPSIKKYAELIKEVLKPGGKILVEVFEYDKALFADLPRPPPPHAMFEDEMRSLYEPECTVELVDKDKRKLKDEDIETVIYLIVKK